MKSMTGFGHAKIDRKLYTIEVSLRAVNGRFLDSRFHLPKEYFSFESDLKKLLQGAVARGTVDVFVTRRVNVKGSAVKLHVNQELAKEYFSVMRKLASNFKIPHQPHVENLIRMPEVISLDSHSDVQKSEKVDLIKTFTKAIEQLSEAKIREGSALKKEFGQALQDLTDRVGLISQQREEANQALKEKFEVKWSTRAEELGADSARWTQELMILLDKSDINEELMRLQEHIKNYRHLVGSNKAEGKKLDFYTQELLREVNTIGSKSQLATLTHQVVEAKTIIERLREQVQNIE